GVREVDVTESPASSARHDDALAVRGEVTQQIAARVVENLRADGNADHEIGGRGAGHLLVATGSSVTCRVPVSPAALEEGGERGAPDEHAAAAIASIASVRTSPRDELLAPEGDESIPAF